MIGTHELVGISLTTDGSKTSLSRFCLLKKNVRYFEVKHEIKIVPLLINNKMFYFVLHNENINKST